MISSIELLKYIQQHPMCNSIQLAKACFNGDEEQARKSLKLEIEYLHCNGYTDRETGDDHTENIQLNVKGEQVLLNFKSQKMRFIIPLIVSFIALVVSIVALLLQYAQYLKP